MNFIIYLFSLNLYLNMLACLHSFNFVIKEVTVYKLRLKVLRII